MIVWRSLVPRCRIPVRPEQLHERVASRPASRPASEMGDEGSEFSGSQDVNGGATRRDARQSDGAERDEQINGTAAAQVTPK